MSRGIAGAIVRYCGHDASFIADIYRVGNVNVIHANGPILKCLTRPCSPHATHWLQDFPSAGFWKPNVGIFAVPASQVLELKAKKKKK